MPNVMCRLARTRVLGARLPFVPHSPDDQKGHDFVSWWRRMHQGRRPLIAVTLKPVTMPVTTDRPPARYLFEICRWPYAASFQWTFICWLIDGAGMWAKEFPTKQAALAYFRLPVETVIG